MYTRLRKKIFKWRDALKIFQCVPWNHFKNVKNINKWEYKEEISKTQGKYPRMINIDSLSLFLCFWFSSLFFSSWIYPSLPWGGRFCQNIYPWYICTNVPHGMRLEKAYFSIPRDYRIVKFASKNDSKEILSKTCKTFWGLRTSSEQSRLAFWKRLGAISRRETLQIHILEYSYV